MSTFFSSALILLAVALVILRMTVRICNQYQRAVMFYLGRYSRTVGPGPYLLIPFLEWRTTVDVRTTTTAVEQQEPSPRTTCP